MINPFVTNDKSNEESKQNESIDKQNMSLMDEGISLLNSNRPKDAINKFKAYQSQNKESDRAYFLLGRCYSKLFNFKEAVEMFNSAISINPDKESYFLNKGVCLFNLGRYEEAIKTLKKGINIEEKDPSLYLNIGACHNNGKCCDGADDNGIPKNLAPAPERLTNWMIRAGTGVGNHAIAGSSIIRIDASRRTILDSVLYRCAGKAAYSCCRRKCTCNNERNYTRDLLVVQDDDAKPHGHVEYRHDWNRLTHDSRDTLQAAPDGDETGDADDDVHHDWAYSKGLIHRAGNSLSLYATGPRAKDKTEYRQNSSAFLPAEGILQHKGAVTDILVHGILIVLTIALADDDLTGLRGHAEESRDPHPNQCARATTDNSCSDTADITCTYGIR